MSLSPGGSTPLPHCNLPPFMGPELLDYWTRCKVIGGSCSHTQIFNPGWILVEFQLWKLPMDWVSGSISINFEDMVGRGV